MTRNLDLKPDWFSGLVKLECVLFCKSLYTWVEFHRLFLWNYTLLTICLSLSFAFEERPAKYSNLGKTLPLRINIDKSYVTAYNLDFPGFLWRNVIFFRLLMSSCLRRISPNYLVFYLTWLFHFSRKDFGENPHPLIGVRRSPNIWDTTEKGVIVLSYALSDDFLSKSS